MGPGSAARAAVRDDSSGVLRKPAMTNWANTYTKQAQHLADTGLYDPADEHDACGVGVIAAIDGEPRREIVLMGIEALKSVWHRGAVDADGKTGDGAGIHVQIPHAFFEDYVRKVGQELSPGKLGIGQIFLPRTDLGKQEVCRVIVEREDRKSTRLNSSHGYISY